MRILVPTSVGLSVVCLVLSPASAGPAPLPLPTTINNFYLRGTQPNGLDPNNEIIPAAFECVGCHQGFGPPELNTARIPEEWSGSLMAQAARDPLFYACLDIAEADAPGSGDMCIRCHVPKAWLEGRSTPTDGSAITFEDRDAITCCFCHRMVDPFDPQMDAPPIDDAILVALGADAPIQSMDLGTPGSPGNGGNGSYVVDPFDRRRGPFPLVEDGFPSPPGVECNSFHLGITFGKCLDEFGDPAGCPTFQSPFHTRSELCATCHDVSNPHFHPNAAGTAFVLNDPDMPHPTGNKYEMVPVERTYSEWLKSDFAVGNGVDMGGRFGAPGQTFVSSCQDCHVPRHTAMGCAFSGADRPDIPQHTFNGASHWVLDAIALHYGPSGPLAGFPPPDPVNGQDLDAETVTALQDNIARNIQMLDLASDMAVVLDDSQTPGVEQLKVTVTNQTGHKLPSGYPEGRRIWLTVEFFDCTSSTNPIAVFGGYDLATATLDGATTKVYEMLGGTDDALASQYNLTPGPGHHFVLTNTIFKDNRIPPRGFTNAGYAAVQAAPVNYSYADGQYWDDTFYDVPAYAVGTRVTLYYQATSREYIEFLRDNNPAAGVDPFNRGELAYALWDAFGQSAPIVMDVVGEAALFDVELKGDLNGDRRVDGDDIADFVGVLVGVVSDPRQICAADMNDLDGPTVADVPLFVNGLLAP